MTRAAMLFIGAATVLVVGAVVAGFALIPSPAHQRVFDLDVKRVEALNTLSQAIQSHVRAHGSLPGSLDEVTQTNELARARSRDVETGRPYDYVKGDDLRYQLCATFGAPTPRGAYADFRHQAGRQCMSAAAAKPK